jgi:hypothetical protein
MTTDQILRTDKLGRVATSRERRAQLLAQYDQSGLSGKRFAEWAGMNYQTFEGWLYDRRKKAREAAAKSAPATPPVRWLEAVVKQDAEAAGEAKSQAALVVRGSGGMRLEISDEQQARLAARFWHELEKARPC